MQVPVEFFRCMSEGFAAFAEAFSRLTQDSPSPCADVTTNVQERKRGREERPVPQQGKADLNESKRSILQAVDAWIREADRVAELQPPIDPRKMAPGQLMWLVYEDPGRGECIILVVLVQQKHYWWEVAVPLREPLCSNNPEQNMKVKAHDLYSAIRTGSQWQWKHASAHQAEYDKMRPNGPEPSLSTDTTLGVRDAAPASGKRRGKMSASPQKTGAATLLNTAAGPTVDMTALIQAASATREPLVAVAQALAANTARNEPSSRTPPVESPSRPVVREGVDLAAMVSAMADNQSPIRSLPIFAQAFASRPAVQSVPTPVAPVQTGVSVAAVMQAATSSTEPVGRLPIFARSFAANSSSQMSREGPEEAEPVLM
jgi:hypothetical protein